MLLKNLRRTMAFTCAIAAISSYAIPASSEPREQMSVEKEVDAIAELLKSAGLSGSANNLNAKILVIEELTDTQPPTRIYHEYNTTYIDTNSDGIPNDGDDGYFNPASTVKPAIAALVLEKLSELGVSRDAKYHANGSSAGTTFSSDIKKMLGYSDNDSTNRLILFLGFDFLNSTMRDRGFQGYTVNRLMGDAGTLLNSPAYTVSENGVEITTEAQSASRQFKCNESGRNFGNCATADDLLDILQRIVEPEKFSSETGFNVRSDDFKWLQKVMGSTPHELGFDKPDDYCRFLQNSKSDILGGQGRLLSKCGVSLSLKTFSDTSFIETANGKKYYTFVSVDKPSDMQEAQAIQWMGRTIAKLISKFP